MYIEFTLPQGATAAGYNLHLIKLSLDEWCNKYQIVCQQKTEKYRHRVTFDTDEYYTLFPLTWNPERNSYLSRWRIVSDLNNKI
jgi:hypothetical protein